MEIEYMEGQGVNEILPLLSNDNKYKVGVAAGKDLFQLHQFQRASWVNKQSKESFPFGMNITSCLITVKRG
ncbi:hypothetical protein ACERII_09345 [Evansella sp. AB-rgal1]|uniref:hypothetical protein n=1 Tax=Evansella sp. AB-rgal1 TaxID=3242696 RepID=UPI00359D589F